jgi:NADPH-dependent 2,4-dienoyl-CoA reductase/sulfur reductase-like enzyme
MRCFCNFLISRTLVIMFTSPVSPLTILSINLKSKVTLIIKRILYRYIYICLKIKPNSVRIRFLSCQIFVLPSTGFELTPLIHCSTNRLNVREIKKLQKQRIKKNNPLLKKRKSISSFKIVSFKISKKCG